MTRFDYFQDIEDTFVRLRGKALLLGPLDWELIERWKTEGVPLHIVIRSIEEVFRNHAARKRARPITSLAYCKSEVEAQFKEYLAARVGAHESEPGAVATGPTGKSDPFPKDQVGAYLDRTYSELLKVGGAKPAPPQAMLIGIAHVLEKLDALSTGLVIAERVDARLLEVTLTELELIIDRSVEASSTPEQLSAATAAAEALYSPYKSNMPEKVYDQQIDNAVKKALREAFGVPRLSLFHMR